MEYPDGRTEPVAKSGVVKNPPVGVYRLHAKKVIHQGLTYHPWQPEQTLTVEANATTEAKILYPLPVYVAQLKDFKETGRRMPMEFLLLPAGDFDMGPTSASTKITFKTAFYMARTECTQAQWQHVTNDNPSYFTQPPDPNAPVPEPNPLARPVERLDWITINKSFIKPLNEQNLGATFSLPSEAQWEYACRAGVTGWDYYFSQDGSNIEKNAWYGKNSEGKTHSVAMKHANQWGLCDMVGNVWELCADDWHSDCVNSFL